MVTAASLRLLRQVRIYARRLGSLGEDAFPVALDRLGQLCGTCGTCRRRRQQWLRRLGLRSCGLRGALRGRHWASRGRAQRHSCLVGPAREADNAVAVGTCWASSWAPGERSGGPPHRQIRSDGRSARDVHPRARRLAADLVEPAAVAGWALTNTDLSTRRRRSWPFPRFGGSPGRLSFPIPVPYRIVRSGAGLRRRAAFTLGRRRAGGSCSSDARALVESSAIRTRASRMLLLGA
mmetsp:Transcript_108468/g.301534  ORF Transcript_108468/g.301534 Transcript_108468/m.301534 type:complete len:236 (+) Transcript_108468:391-1098(+)